MFLWFPVVTPCKSGSLPINTTRLFAQYSDDISGIDVSSAKVTLDGNDVTTDSTITATSVNFTPTIDLADELHTVAFEVKDLTGNMAEAQTSFTILPPAPNN